MPEAVPAPGGWATESVCPVCLAPVPARVEPEGDAWVLVKRCPEHGESRAVIWRGEPGLPGWTRPKTPSFPRTPRTAVRRGCPLDCGLCPEHGQHTCTALMEITWRCDLGCPVCFASSGDNAPPDPPLAQLAWQLDQVLAASGRCNVQLSGGEPSVRDDLPEIVALAKARFPFVQLNTNGLRAAREPGFAPRLAAAGLDSVFLQFDGLSDDVYR
ncbi:MAG: radical SAM protein, partial [Desulfovibrionaceae bacterium]